MTPNRPGPPIDPIIFLCLGPLILAPLSILSACASNATLASAPSDDTAGEPAPDLSTAEAPEPALSPDMARALDGYRQLADMDLSGIFGTPQTGATPPVTPPNQPLADAASPIDPTSQTETQTASAAIAAVADAPIPPAATEPAPPATSAALLGMVAGRISHDSAGSDDPAHGAVRLAMLAALEPDQLDPEFEVYLQRHLAPSEAEAVRSIRAMLGRLTTGGASGAPEAIERAAAEMAARLPLRITATALCWEVGGLGDYKPFDHNTFLAGSIPAIGLYVELDRAGHVSETGADGAERHRFDLSLEVMLHHEADGLLVWKRPAERVTLRSRTALRDVSLAAALEWPQSLTVGRYRLKVVVQDEVGGGVAEASIPLELVADERLIGTRGRLSRAR